LRAEAGHHVARINRDRQSQTVTIVIEAMPTKLTALAIAIAILLATISLSRAADEPPIILAVGTKGMTLMLERPFKAVLIGDPDVVDVLIQGDRLATLQPQGLGATNVVFLDEGNIAIANFRVVVSKTGAKNISFNGQANCEQAEIERIANVKSVGL